MMFRLNLGRGAVAFENEGDADGVGSVSANDLTARHWPPELVENIRRYQEQLTHPPSTVSSETIETSLLPD